MISLNINGKAISVDAEPDTPLLWVLRDHLNMTGTKYGCGMALCGACTVHINDAPARSCSTPAASAAGKRITTIEAIGATKEGKGRKRRAPVRLLPVGPDHERGRVAREDKEAHGRRDRGRDERQRLPLRHL
jgi:ferredoxin